MSDSALEKIESRLARIESQVAEALRFLGIPVDPNVKAKLAPIEGRIAEIRDILKEVSVEADAALAAEPWTPENQAKWNSVKAKRKLLNAEWESLSDQRIAIIRAEAA